MTDFLSDVEGLSPGSRVELYALDLNPIGTNLVIRWTPSRQDGGSLWWQGYEYISRPIQLTGLKKSGQDKPPQPKLSVGNIDGGGYALVKQYDELYGCILTRMTTLVQYLDKNLDGTTNPRANSSAMYLPEIWIVEQRTTSDPIAIQWTVSSPMDFQNKKLPNRRAYRDICTRVYRYYDTASGTFKTSPVNACPYAGSSYFKRDGSATTNPALDDCTQDLNGCTLRFGSQRLPIWAFPGLRKIGS